MFIGSELRHWRSIHSAPGLRSSEWECGTGFLSRWSHMHFYGLRMFNIRFVSIFWQVSFEQVMFQQQQKKTVGRCWSGRSDRFHARRSGRGGREEKSGALVEFALGRRRRLINSPRGMSSFVRREMEYVFVILELIICLYIERLDSFVSILFQSCQQMVSQRTTDA